MKNKKWVDMNDHYRTTKQTEDENRSRFRQQKEVQATMVYKAREQAYLENKKNS